MGVAQAPGRLGGEPEYGQVPRPSVSERVYAGLLRAYPRKFRARYQAEMVLLFSDQLRDARTANGAGGITVIWLRTLLDLVASAFGEHLRKDRTMAQSLATFEPTRSMRWLGLVGLAGGALLLFAFITFSPFEARWANMVRLVTFSLGQAAIALAFYRRQALAAPTVAFWSTALVVFAGVGYALWLVLALWVPSPFSGSFGALNLFGNGLLWLSAALFGVALLRTGAVWKGMPRRLGLVARLGAIALLGSALGWIGDDRLGLVDSEPYGQLIGSLAMFGVFLNGLGWVLLGSVLVFGGRGARSADAA
jgi:hypothetical protein